MRPHAPWVVHRDKRVETETTRASFAVCGPILTTDFVHMMLNSCVNLQCFKTWFWWENNSSFDSLERQLSNDVWFVTVRFIGKAVAEESIEVDHDFSGLVFINSRPTVSVWPYIIRYMPSISGVFHLTHRSLLTKDFVIFFIAFTVYKYRIPVTIFLLFTTVRHRYI